VSRTRRAAALLLLAILAGSLGADWVARTPYEAQDRDHLNAAPSRRFPLGTDELGRDRFSRLLHGARVSLLLAPAAALVSVAISALLGILAGHWGGWRERVILSGTDLVLSLPWLFLLLTVRAMLPLNVSPCLSVIITFALLGLLGWAAAARVIHAGVRGCPPGRVLWTHILPNLRPLLLAQFWILVPASC
jgi:peptide/nickel transport system permease protein